MNVFLIPSWYPSASSPSAGIFTKEQLFLYSQSSYCEKVIVSLWGHAETEVPIRTPWRLVKALCWWMKNRKPYLHYVSPYYVEIRNAALHWSHRLPWGGWAQLYATNRENFLIALKTFEKIDIIHAHVGYPAGVIAQKLSEEFDVPYVITEHMGPFPFRSLVKRGEVIPTLKQAYTSADGVVAVSPYLARSMAEKGCGFPVIIPNFIDEESFQPHTRTDKPFVFLTLCTMNEQKGVRCLLQAIRYWSPAGREVRFLIAGDGPELESFKEEANQLGIAALICWLGHVKREDVPSLFTQANVFVLPSYLETFGVVYLEAIASGLPVVATRCGGPESIVNEINGLLVDVGDARELSGALQSIFLNYASFHQEDIRRDFEARFSKENAIKKLADFYEGVAGKAKLKT